MIDMYASDVTHRKRAQAVYRNLQMQKEFFSSGATIRILGQKGGNDYSYMIDVEEGCVRDTCWQLGNPATSTSGNRVTPEYTGDMIEVNLAATDASGNPLIYDAGYGTSAPIPGVIDDGNINIPMNGMDFFFFGTNYGAAGNIFFNSNNAITFGSGDPTLVSVSRDTVPAILLGNYDHLLSKLFTSTSNIGNGAYSCTKIIARFSNYYTDTTNFDAGRLQVRLIREYGGQQRQWVEVTVFASASSPGYSNNPSINYPSGRDASGNSLDADGFLIDSTKNSPWDITDGTRFLNLLGTTYSDAYPPAGTTILYESGGTGYGWRFINNAYLNF